MEGLLSVMRKVERRINIDWSKVDRGGAERGRHGC